MTREIRKVSVLGSGVVRSAIAATSRNRKPMNRLLQTNAFVFPRLKS
jgi:3-hydroxyacyl-CoA dehydrogenase